MSSEDTNEKYTTLVELLSKRAYYTPNQVAYTFLSDGVSKEENIIYEELDYRAKAIGSLLQHHISPKNRVLLLYQPGIEYINAFFGCIYAGVVAVPVYPPRFNRPMPRLEAIIADAQASTILTTTTIKQNFQPLFAQNPQLAHLQWLATDQISDKLDTSWETPHVMSDDLAFLQYTSGSTSLPKGVMVTHGNLLHNLASIHYAFSLSTDSRGVIWLPPYHDMGLIGGILGPLYGRFPVTLLSPFAFLQNPLHWLQTIMRVGATESGGPNFAYDLCVQRITPEQKKNLDLSSWKLAFTGAEPIRASTMKNFSEAFASCGFREESFYPCYGLAEATLIVSGNIEKARSTITAFDKEALQQGKAIPSPKDDASAQLLVGCGQGLSDQKIAIVNPSTGLQCLEGVINEVWVSGSSITKGYWNRPEETEQVFHAYIADTKEGPFLRTGDLGFLRDNELFIIGRLKDLIIIRGRNHYPQDIEQTVGNCCQGLRSEHVAVFSVDADAEERLVVVCEVTRHYQELDIDEVIRCIRQAVARHHELQVYAVALLRPGSIPLTSSGKIQRYKCKEEFLSRSLNTVATSVLHHIDSPEEDKTLTPEFLFSMEAEERHRWMDLYFSKIVSRVLRVSPSQLTDNYSLNAMGFDSLAVFELKNAIEYQMGVVLPISDFFQQISMEQFKNKILMKMTENTINQKGSSSTYLQENATYPLSYGQKALWFLYQLDPSNTAYNVARAVKIRENVNIAAFQWAFQTIVDRHVSLRTNFFDLNGMPLQKIRENSMFSLQVDYASYKDNNALQEHLVEIANLPFNLEQDMLIRANLFKCDENEYILLLVVHHIIADFWSLVALIHEFGLLYSEKNSQTLQSLAPLNAQFADYVQWQRDMLAGPEGERHWVYWQQQLAGDLPILNLPFDHPRSAVQQYSGAILHFRLSGHLARKLKLICQQENVTLYALLLAAFQVLLYRCTGQDDILVGTPTAGRNSAQFSNLIGYFVNPVVLRVHPSPGLTFLAFLRQVWQIVLEAFEHQDYPFPLLVEQLQPKRDPSCSPLFQVTFALQKSPSAYEEDLAAFALGERGSQATLGDLTVESIALDTRAAQFDLSLTMAENKEGLLGSFQYNTDLFDRETIERLAKHYQVLLEDIVTNLNQQLSLLPLLEEQQLEIILREWNATKVEYNRNICIHTFFESQVAKRPDAVAAFYQGEHITYQKLNELANQLAHHLIFLGVGSGILVATYLERSLIMLPTLLGILKAGGAYVPLESGMPRERLHWILSTLDVHHLVTNDNDIFSCLDLRFLENLEHIIRLDTFGEQGDQKGTGESTNILESKQIWTYRQLGKQSTENPSARATADDLAYIIFTSGSTGTPKGVMVSHRPVINLIEWVNTTFQIGPLDRVLFITSLCFDLSVYDIFGLLAAGGSIHIVPEEDLRDPERLVQILSCEPVTFWDSAPPALQQLVPYFPALDQASMKHHLRLVFLSGDWIPVKLPDQVRQAFLYARVVSLGGATEATVWSNYYPIEQVDPQWISIPYGKPIQNAQYYVLDPYLNPCPIGVPGDLYIGGECLSLGYAQETVLTAEKYIPDPFAQYMGARLYKTGDQARYETDGNLEFLGRRDHQVKIRGFRIELGEIEFVLSQHPAIQEAVVVVKNFTDNDKRLIAYVVPDQQNALPVHQMLRLQDSGLLEGRRLYNLPNGMTIIHQNKNETEFMYNNLLDEERTWQNYGITLNDSDCVFDVGANIGLFSLLINRRYKNIRLFAFEPIPATFEVLRLNMELYAVLTHVFNCGLSSQSINQTLTYYPHLSILSGRFANEQNEREMLRLLLSHQQQDGFQEALLTDDLLDELLRERLLNKQVVCQMRKLSEVMSEHQLERIDLLKIDVEKSELDVLYGIEEDDWAKIRQIVMEVYDVDGRLEYITTLLKERGYILAIAQETATHDTAFYNIYARRLEVSSSFAEVPRMDDDGHQKEQTLWCSENLLLKDVRRFLRERLPGYMLPAAFGLLAALPLTSNGKLNRQALPEPVQGGLPDETFMAPRTSIEQTLVEIWRSVLGLQRIGVYDNFFELGGHSLLATQIISRVREMLQKEVPLRILFEHPTIIELGVWIAQEASEERVVTIPVVTRDQNLLLSFAQQRLWFLEQMLPGTSNYILPGVVRLQGALNCTDLEESLNTIIARHEMLRTCFVAEQGLPIQVIVPGLYVPLPLVDLQTVSENEREAQVQDLILTECQQPFDLTQVPLLRFKLFRLGEQEYILLLIMHHIISDGWSVGVLIKELAALYGTQPSSKHAPLPKLPIQYIDYTLWQRSWLQGDRLEKQLTYWRNHLAHAPSILDLPIDHPRPSIQSSRGATYTCMVPKSISDELVALSRQEEVALFMTLLAAFKVLLLRYTGQEDLVVGTPIANRTQTETEDLIGFFANTLVLRSDLSGNPCFLTVLRRVREVCLDAYTHQDLPFEKLVEDLQPERDPSHTPLFQVMFALQNIPMPPIELAEVKIQQLDIEMHIAKFDLTLSIEEGTEGLTGSFEYNTDLFEATTIERLANHWLTLLESIVADSSQSIWQLSLMDEAERHLILAQGSSPQTDTSSGLYIHGLIAEQATCTPEAIAVIFEDAALTYQELEQRANQLGHYLQKLGVGPDVLVGICIERSLEMVIGLLGILKAGGAFVPFDPTHPKDRLAFVLDDSEISVLLTQQKHVGRLPEFQHPVICLDTGWEVIGQEQATSVASNLTIENLAYVIYTSGSTGKAKGVLITHEAIVSYCNTVISHYRLNANDQVLQFAALTFDASLEQIFPTLIAGAKLILRSAELWSTTDFHKKILDFGLTVINFPTAYWQELVQEWIEEPKEMVYSHLRLVIVGGDRILPYHFHLWQQLSTVSSIRLLNGYGPTETTIGTTTFEFPPLTSKPQSLDCIPIGRHLSPRTVYILDKYGNPVPNGVPGELYIGGITQARGYLKRPDLTAERFIPNPFSTTSGARLYKSGDLVRYLSTGDIEFLGRMDHQVKVRGFRIELGEIETVLNQHPAVYESVILSREDKPGNMQLVAYVINRLPEKETTANELQNFLHSKLPSYMVPSFFVWLETLPLTPNGKLDRKALPAPNNTRPDLEMQYIAPRTPLEEKLAQLWREVLGIEQIGIYDNFFDLGGHSLLLVQVHSKLQNSIENAPSLVDMFTYPNINTLVRHIVEGIDDIPLIQKSSARAKGRKEAYRRRKQFRSSH